MSSLERINVDPQAHLSVVVPGRLAMLMAIAEGAGWDSPSSMGLRCDHSIDEEGNEILIVQSLRTDRSGEWGLVWRTSWAWASLTCAQAGELLELIEQGAERLAQAAAREAAASTRESSIAA